MESWKRNNLSLHVGDSEEDPIIMSDNEEVEALPSSEESYHAPPLAECIGPVCTGQCAICSSPGYREARKQRREKLKAKRMEPIKGTHTMRKRAAEEFFEGLLSKAEALAVALGAYGSDSEKEN